MTPTRKDKPPTQEVGTVTDRSLLPVAGTTWLQLQHEEEFVPELRWPNNLNVFERIATDPQVAGILLAFIGPIAGRKIVLNRNGASDELVQAISEDLGVPVLGDDEDKPTLPIADRFDIREHIETVLWQALVYGHYVSELVGAPEKDTTRAWWRLQNLSPRPAKTITSWFLDPSGSGKLVSLQQHYSITQKPIPAEQLAIWSWRKRPGSFTGTSMLRPMYKPYLLKDGASRITMTNIEKAGGIAYANAPVNAGDKVMATINSVLSRFRVGSRSAATFPAGTKVDFAKGAGVGEGINFINLQNEEIAYAAQMMFAGLGQGGSTGNRALGQTLVQAFIVQQEAAATWLLKGFNRDVIERISRWNVGDGQQAPLLEFVPDDGASTIDALVAAKNAGLLQVDDGVLDSVRKRLKLGAFDPLTAQAPPPVAAPAVAVPGAVQALRQIGGESSASPVAAAAPFRLTILAADGPGVPKRDLKRIPSPRETAAGIDFAAMDQQREATLSALLTAWLVVQDEQTSELRAAVIAAEGDAGKLAQLEPGVLGFQQLFDAGLQIADEGIRAAIAEAKYQGVALTDPEALAVYAAVRAQAQGTALLLAQDLGLAASRAAMRYATPTLTGTQLAELVIAEITARPMTGVETQLHGFVTGAQLVGRTSAWHAAPAGTRYFATEILDGNTCTECAAIDETEFPTLEAGLRAYPTGGYRKCLGRLRCRGSLFARYGDETPATMNGDEFNVKAAAEFDESKIVRDGHGRFSRKFGLPDLKHHVFEGMAGRTRKNRGGTFDPHSGAPVKGPDGWFQVALPAADVEREVPNDDNLASEIRQYRADFAHLLVNERYYLGTYFAENGNITIDVSEMVKGRDNAMQLGRLRGQESIVDWEALNAGRWDDAFPSTGGTVGER
jgi:hypothetical protein